MNRNQFYHQKCTLNSISNVNPNTILSLVVARSLPYDVHVPGIKYAFHNEFTYNVHLNQAVQKSDGWWN
jgi:hypothetical protein